MPGRRVLVWRRLKADRMDSRSGGCDFYITWSTIQCIWSFDIPPTVIVRVTYELPSIILKLLSCTYVFKCFYYPHIFSFSGQFKASRGNKFHWSRAIWLNTWAREMFNDLALEIRAASQLVTPYLKGCWKTMLTTFFETESEYSLGHSWKKVGT